MHSYIFSLNDRQSVQEALRSLKARLGLYKKTPTNGLALFCGYHLNEDGKDRKLMIDLEPLMPLAHSLYKCGSQFHTELLRAQLEEGGKFGFIVMYVCHTSFLTANFFQ